MKNIKFPLILAMGLISSLAYGGQVKMSTYYPAPEGDYKNVNSTENANFATTSGNVGVGTTTPSGKLHVKTLSSFTPVFLTAGTGAGATAGTWRVQADNGIASQGAAFTIYSDTAAKHRLFINGSGTVGINTSSPQTTQVNPSNGTNRSIHLDVAESIVADDVYLRSPTFGSARWASQKPNFSVNRHVRSSVGAEEIGVHAFCALATDYGHCSIMEPGAYGGKDPAQWVLWVKDNDTPDGGTPNCRAICFDVTN